MAALAPRTVPSSPNPSLQGSPRSRDWTNLGTGEPGSAFRGISRGRGSRGGGVRGGCGGGHPPSNLGQKGSLPETTNTTSSSSPKVSSISRKPHVPSITVTLNGTEKPVNGATERGGRPKPGSRKQPRATAPGSSSETSQTAPPTPSRSANRRNRSQPGKGPVTTTKPLLLPNAIKSQKSRAGSTPASQTVIRKDIPPHLVAAHEAEIRHDIDALVERVRAVAMAENRPTTPGSHIDWAGEEDDSLPDLDDWGITTTHTNTTTRDEDKSEEISPILADALKPLPEPSSNAQQEGEEQEMETYDARPDQESPTRPPTSPSPTKKAAALPPTTEKAQEQCTIVPTAAEEPSSPTLPNGKPLLHPSLPPKPAAAMGGLRAKGRSISKPPSLPPRPPLVATEEELLTEKAEGLAESIHAPSVDERLRLERVSSASSSERGLTTSVHAPVPGLPESHSAPSLLTNNSSPALPRTHARSQTEGRPGSHQPHTAPPGTVSHRHGRSGASSPLGKHVYTHSRNHSTPAGSSRPPQTSRPVITGDAISRLARTIGGLGPTSRTTAARDSTISS